MSVSIRANQSHGQVGRKDIIWLAPIFGEINALTTYASLRMDGQHERSEAGVKTSIS